MALKIRNTSVPTSTYHIVPNVVVSSSGVQDRDRLTARDVLDLGRHFARFTTKQKNAQ